MTEPEIARRCPSCGASIRDLAFFCPQCGKQLAEKDPNASQRSTSVVTAPLEDVSPAKKAVNAAEPARPAVQSNKEPPDQKQKDAAIQSQKIPAGRAAPGGGRAKLQRATTLARDVEGDVIHRVQKLREISTVVLDEAGYDPSLRFVLVAALLFGLFLVIVLLNKFIR